MNVLYGEEADQSHISLFAKRYFNIFIIKKIYFTTNILMPGSSPTFPLRSHSLVHSKNNSHFVGIGPICDIESTCIFCPIFSLCNLYIRYVSLLLNKFLIHICYQMLLSWHWIMFCVLFWCRIWNNAHCVGIYIYSLHQHTAPIN